MNEDEKELIISNIIENLKGLSYYNADDILYSCKERIKNLSRVGI